MITSTITIFKLQKKYFAASLLAILTTTSARADSSELTKSKQLTIESSFVLGETKEYGKVMVGGLSGLVFDEVASTTDKLVFYSLTDRGPNAKKKDFTKDGYLDRPFILPNYVPRLVKIEYIPKNGKATVTKLIEIKKPGSKEGVTGIPNVDLRSFPKYHDETPVTADGKRLKFDPWGIDPESIIIDAKGNFWIGEEYGPSILKISKDGEVKGRWNPQVEYKASYKVRAGKNSLPPVFKERKLNAGFEGMALSGKYLFTFLQKPLPTKPKSKLIRVLKFNTETEKSEAVYLYEMDKNSKKIGGATTLSNGNIAVLEHSGEKGKEAYQRIYEISFEGSDNLLASNEIVEKNKKKRKKIKTPKKKLIANINNFGVFISEKPEGIALLPNGTIAMINDNDFNLAHIHNKKKADADREENLFMIFSK